MSITLRLEHDGERYLLPRANARITTSAQLARGDQLRIAGVHLVVTGFEHVIPQDPLVAPTTYADASVSADVDEALLSRLEAAGFSKDPRNR